MIVQHVLNQATEQQTTSPAVPTWMVGAAVLAGLLWLGRKSMKSWIRGRIRREKNRATHRLGGRKLPSLRPYLAPLGSGLAAMLAVAALRGSDPGLYWLPGVIGATLVALGMWRAAAERISVPVGYARLGRGALLALLGSWTVAQGIDGGVVLAGLLGVLATAVPYWAEMHRSGTYRIKARLEHGRWGEMCEARGMTGLKRGRIVPTAAGLDVMLTLNGKLTLEGLQNRVTDLETGLGTRTGAIRIEGRSAANKALLRITTADPLAGTIPLVLGTEPMSITTLAPVSMTAHGETIALDLQERILIVGSSGSGKSSIQRALAAPVIRSVDAVLEVWDFKQGTESQHYLGAERRITSSDEAIARVEELLTEEFAERAGVLKSRKSSTWKPTPENPARVVMVDEGAALIRDLTEPQLKRVFTVAEQGRALGVYLWWATQFPKATNLPTELTANMSVTIALKMRKDRESRVVFGADGVKEGWTPHRLPGKGWMLIQSETISDPEESRGLYLTETQLRKLTRPAVTPVAVTEVAPVAVVIPPKPTFAPPSTSPVVPVLSNLTEELVVFATADRVSLRDRVAQARAELAAAEAAAEAAEAAAAPDPSLAEAPADIYTALIEGPAEGLSVAELAARLGLGKSRVYDLVKEATESGRAVKVGRGRYTLSTPATETTVATPAQDESVESA